MAACRRRSRRAPARLRERPAARAAQEAPASGARRQRGGRRREPGAAGRRRGRRGTLDGHALARSPPARDAASRPRSDGVRLARRRLRGARREVGGPPRGRACAGAGGREGRARTARRSGGAQIRDWAAAFRPRRSSTSSGTTSRSCSPTTSTIALELLPIPPEMTGARGRPTTRPSHLRRLRARLLGVRREVGGAVEALAEPPRRRGTWTRGRGPRTAGPPLRCDDPRRPAATVAVRPRSARLQGLAAPERVRARLGVVGSSTSSTPRRARRPRARAVGTALPIPGARLGRQRRGAWAEEAGIGVSSVALAQVALAVDYPAGRRARVGATPRAMPSRCASRPAPRRRRSIWSSRFVLAGLGVVVRRAAPVGPKASWWSGRDGSISRVPAATTTSNRGRWYWGDDIGWEWGAFLTPAPGPAFVLSRATDRSHRPTGNPMLVVQRGEPAAHLRRADRPGSSSPGGSRDDCAACPGRWRRCTRIERCRACRRASSSVPGTASIASRSRSRRAPPRSPFAADPFVRGYGFLHEMAGNFTVPVARSVSTTSPGAGWRSSSM